MLVLVLVLVLCLPRHKSQQQFMGLILGVAPGQTSLVNNKAPALPCPAHLASCCQNRPLVRQENGDEIPPQAGHETPAGALHSVTTCHAMEW